MGSWSVWLTEACGSVEQAFGWERDELFGTVNE